MPRLKTEAILRTFSFLVRDEGERHRPAPVLEWGRWRRLRTCAGILLLALLVAMPLLEVRGLPLLRLDLTAGRLFLAGRIFWLDEFAVLAAIACAAAGLLYLPAILTGRAFCAWLCPHTVLVEIVLRPLEAVIAVAGASGPLRGLRTRRLCLAVNWFAIVALCLVVSRSLLALLAGNDAFLLWVLPDVLGHPLAAIGQLLLLAPMVFAVGYMRELWCQRLCPYPRLVASNIRGVSRVVRFSGRRADRPDDASITAAADTCVDGCRRCADVCPAGIDIRDGRTAACIDCGACVDACRSVMTLAGRRRPLVRYACADGRPVAAHDWRRPDLVLAVLLVVVGATGLACAVVLRRELRATMADASAVSRARPLAAGNDAVDKRLVVRLDNRGPETRLVTLAPHPAVGGRVLPPGDRVRLPPDGTSLHRLVVRMSERSFGVRGVLDNWLLVRSERGGGIAVLPFKVRRPPSAGTETTARAD